MKFKTIQPLPIALALIGLIIIVYALMHFSQFPDPSQEIAFIFIGLFIIFIAYDNWWKRTKEGEYQELVKMCDSFLNWKMKVENKENDKTNRRLA